MPWRQHGTLGGRGGPTSACLTDLEYSVTHRGFRMDIYWGRQRHTVQNRQRMITHHFHQQRTPLYFFHNIIFAFLSLKLVFFWKFFFFFLQCGFRALTSWRCDGIFRDLIIIVALIAFFFSRYKANLKIWKYATSETVSAPNRTLETVSPVVHR